MKLAEYLADYIEYERQEHMNCAIGEDMLQEGIEAFASTEGKSIIIFEAANGICVRERIG